MFKISTIEKKNGQHLRNFWIFKEIKHEYKMGLFYTGNVKNRRKDGSDEMGREGSQRGKA